MDIRLMSNCNAKMCRRRGPSVENTQVQVSSQFGLGATHKVGHEIGTRSIQCDWGWATPPKKSVTVYICLSPAKIEDSRGYGIG